jgi:hypothetical protein
VFEKEIAIEEMKGADKIYAELIQLEHINIGRGLLMYTCL